MDLFDLVAKITLDSSEYEKQMREAGDSADSLSSNWSKFGKVMKVGAVAIGATASAVGMLTKSSVDAYANYQQLAGGVQKLYGDSADQLMEYANNAYKTSGMSANQYMEQATSFSASLINSLGGDTDKAVEQTDVAMRAISDNFNTFGGDIQNVQNAFQGFAKGQFNMLDNLRLGYGGTKTEMQRLIDDANEYADSIGMASDLSIDSFSDIVTAIDLIQQKQGIAGTTAKESATTIEGALNMTKSAWENLVAGFANPDADLGKLMDNLVVAIVGENEGEGLLNQIMPAIQNALEGIGTLLEQAVPILSEQLPPIIESMLPSLISATMSLITGLANALPSLMSVIIQQIPTILNTVINAFVTNLPLIAQVAPQLILTLSQGIADNLPTLIPAVVEMVVSIVETLAENADMLIEAGAVLIVALVEGLLQALPTLIGSAPKIVKALVSALGSAGSRLLSTGVSVVKNFVNGVVRGFSSMIGRIVSSARRVPTAIKNGVGNLSSIGMNLIEGLWGGIKSKFNSVVDRVKALASSLPKAVKKVLGISSPSRVFMEVGKWIPEGLALGIERNMGVVQSATDAMADATSFVPDSADFGVSGFGMGSGVQITNYITVDGADNPEDFANRFVRQLQLDMRTI